MDKGYRTGFLWVKNRLALAVFGFRPNRFLPASRVNILRGMAFIPTDRSHWLRFESCSSFKLYIACAWRKTRRMSAYKRLARLVVRGFYDAPLVVKGDDAQRSKVMKYETTGLAVAVIDALTKEEWINEADLASKLRLNPNLLRQGPFCRDSLPAPRCDDSCSCSPGHAHGNRSPYGPPLMPRSAAATPFPPPGVCCACSNRSSSSFGSTEGSVIRRWWW